MQFKGLGVPQQAFCNANGVCIDRHIACRCRRCIYICPACGRYGYKKLQTVSPDEILPHGGEDIQQDARFHAGAAMLHTVLLPARSQTKKARQSSLRQNRPASHSHIRCRAGAVHSEGLYLQQSPKIAIQSFVRLFIRKDVPAHAHTPAFPDVPSSVGRKPYSGEALLPLT